MDEHRERYVRADGEKVKNVEAIHVLHPGAPLVLDRSALLVATRGAGKTLLLRHRKKTEHPGAIYISLWKTLHSINRSAGLGGRVVAYSENNGLRIQQKTAALVACKVLAESLEHADWGSTDLALLNAVLPDRLHTTGHVSAASVSAQTRAVTALPLRHWDERPVAVDLMETLSAISEHRDHETLLFLDRAEDAPSPAASLLLNLLDQSFDLLTVMASRPGLVEQLMDSEDSTLIPGDHFNIIHLGTEPYGDEWQQFSLQATMNYLTDLGLEVEDPDSVRWAISMGRDSLRTAIELAQISLSTQRDMRARVRQVAAAQTRFRLRVKARMKPLSYDFLEVVDIIKAPHRRELRRNDGQVVVEFSVADHVPGELGKTTEVLNRAVACESALLPVGHHWHPFQMPDRFELSPLLVWEEGLTSWIAS